MTINNMLNTATTPISVPEGGTGVASATAYAVLCGGTTTTSAIQPLAALGASGSFLGSNGAAALPSFQAMHGRLLSFQILTSGSAATYTPTSASVSTLIVETLGGGGGGGGVSSAASSTAAGAGGASGSYQQIGVSPLGVGYTATYTVGAGGAGGTAGANAGSSGNATTWNDSLGTSLSTGGGGGGGAGTASLTATAALGGIPGTSTPSGAPAGTCGYTGLGCLTNAIGGAGGSSFYGGGGNATLATTGVSTAGNNGTNYGGGGSGGATFNHAASNVAGGNGSSGIIIVWEFS